MASLVTTRREARCQRADLVGRVSAGVLGVQNQDQLLGHNRNGDHKRYYSKPQLWMTLRRAGFLPSKMRVRRHMFRFALFAVAEK